MLTHEFLSFSPEDTPQLTVEKLYDLTRAYIYFRNPNGMYVAVPHFDKDHIHIHLCVASIEYRSGSSMRMTKTQFRQFKHKVQEYQVEHYPELTHSLVDHGKQGRSYRIFSTHTTIKERLQNIVQSAFSHATSLEHFIERLKNEGVEVYYRKGKLQGILHNNKKWRWRRLEVRGLNQYLQQNRKKELRITHNWSKG